MRISEALLKDAIRKAVLTATDDDATRIAALDQATDDCAKRPSAYNTVYRSALLALTFVRQVYDPETLVQLVKWEEGAR
jgi:hypothetical protein